MDEVSPFMLFKKFFDSDAVDFILDMTNLYACRDKGKPGQCPMQCLITGLKI